MVTGCISRQIIDQKMNKITSELINSKVIIEIKSTPSLADPNLVIAVSRKLTENVKYNIITKYKKSVTHFGQVCGLLCFGSALTLVILTKAPAEEKGVWLYTGYSGGSVVPLIAQYLIEHKPSLKSKTKHEIEYSQYPMQSEQIKIEVPDINYFETVITDSMGIIRFDVRKLYEKFNVQKIQDESMAINVFSTANLNVSETAAFWISTEFLKQLFISDNIKQAKEMISECLLDSAISNLQKVLNADKYNIEALELLQKVNGYKNGADIDFRPKDWQAYRRLAKYCLQAGKQNTATEYIKKMWKLAPSWDINFSSDETQEFRSLVIKIKNDEKKKYDERIRKRERILDYILEEHGLLFKYKWSDWRGFLLGNKYSSCIDDDKKAYIAGYGGIVMEMAKANTPKEALRILITCEVREESLLIDWGGPSFCIAVLKAIELW